ncbi:hypothetical protein LUZ60_016799 [Juncus effusus]|nr:hypothetical protein LUZ60_016799 [Juncus effusus]
MEFKRKLSMSSSLLILLLFLALSVSFCEGRSSRKLLPHLRKDLAKVNVEEPSSLVKKVDKTHGTTTVEKSRRYENKRKGVNLRSVEEPCCANKSNSVRVSQQVQPYRRREEDPGFHLDYTGPRTHPPSHN